MARVHAFALARRDGVDGFPFRLTIEGTVRGRWLALAYEASLLGPARRPLLRILREGGHEDALHEDALLPGPCLGRGHYLGFLPADAREILVATEPEAVEAGRWRIARVTTRSTAAMLGLCLVRRPDRLPQALYLGLRRDGRRFRNTLRGALATTPVPHYADWRRTRLRDFSAERDGVPAGEALTILVLTTAGPGLAQTRASFLAQDHAGWRLVILGEEASDDGRIVVLPADTPLDAAALCAAYGADALGILAPGDVLAPHALAVLADRLAGGDALVYGDEEVLSDGRLEPRLKPAWSPDLARVSGLYPGRPALYAAAFLTQAAVAAPTPAALERALARAAADTAGLAVSRVTQPLARRVDAPPPTDAPDVVWPLPNPAPLVSIVMPSRDRLELVSTSVSGVLDATDYPALEVVLVDNGSTDPAVRAFYAERARDPRFRVLERSGPFNFSALNNDGVAAARGEVVVLLNNDVAILHPDWLSHLVRQARRPDVGAVGAKLLHADGKLQHAGVVVGLGGYAGHILRRRPGDAPGHLGRLRVAHEVSAVTAACLAVSREKYLAVGGLDAESFPVDFNDVDFCLRLGARGWRTIWTPHARLAHLESVSRGRPQGATRARFEAEAARFAERWRETIRDDPFYHPALSVTTFGEDLE